jgi:O-antigen ligase
LALLGLLSFILRRIFFIFFQSTKQEKLRWPLFFPFFIFLFFLVLSAFFSNQPLNSLWAIARWPLFLYLAFIFLPDNLINNVKIFKKSLLVLLASTLMVLLSGYLSLYGQDWHNSFFQIKSIGWQGIYPFGINHNLIAEFLNVGVFLILSTKFLIKNVRIKRLMNVAFILSVIAIILTFSRTAWITLALQTIIYVWYYLRTKKYKTKNIITALAIFLILSSPLIWKMDNFQEKNGSSTASRWLLTEISWQSFLNRPYLGYGSGQFINLVDNNTRFIAKYGAPIDSHGFLQKILAENGIFALMSWIFILIYLLKIAYTSIKKYQAKNPWLLPLWLGAGGGLFFQFFNTSYYKGKVWLPVTLALVGVRLITQYYEDRKQKQN